MLDDVKKYEFEIPKEILNLVIDTHLNHSGLVNFTDVVADKVKVELTIQGIENLVKTLSYLVDEYSVYRKESQNNEYSEEIN